MNADEVALRVGVADLLSTYQFLADTGRIDELTQLFLPDAVFATNTGNHVGPSEIEQFFRATGRAFVETGLLPARHHLSTVHVQPSESDAATTYACFQLIGAIGLDHWGTYRDVVRLVDGKWRFQRRVVKIEGHVSDSPVVELLGLKRGPEA